MNSYNIVDITPENYSQHVLESKVPVIIDFWAPWCGPCRAMESVFKSVAHSINKEKEVVKFVKINVDNNTSLATQFQITSIPCFVYMQSGVIKKVKTGAMTESTLSEFITL